MPVRGTKNLIFRIEVYLKSENEILRLHYVSAQNDTKGE
jgi:hypothetical protein